jgi:hypothetical protein
MKPIIKALKSFSIRTAKTLGKLLLAIIISSPLAYIALKGAYNTRGYYAVGGEWILSIGMVILVFWMIDKKAASHE